MGAIEYFKELQLLSLQFKMDIPKADKYKSIRLCGFSYEESFNVLGWKLNPYKSVSNRTKGARRLN